MNETIELQASADSVAVEPTPLAEALGHAAGALVETRGALTFSLYSDAAEELSALTHGVAVHDQGARLLLRISGEDRVRWLNGMVTNNVKALTPGDLHYTFLLNAQGKIQGDATVHALADHLLIETDRAQAHKLHAHLDHFIIMDDVELAWVEEHTALGVTGPEAAALLARLGLPVPEADRFAADPSTDITVVAEYSPATPRYTLWMDASRLIPTWEQLLAAGATPCGATAVEALRVLQGIPLYGVEISDRTLAQETGQTRALHFTKGCYLGQEIVERIRSRAVVHRGLRQFALSGAPAGPQAPLSAEGAVVGELTSLTAPGLSPSGIDQVALSIVRVETIDRGATLSYPGGIARPLATSPLSDFGLTDR